MQFQCRQDERKILAFSEIAFYWSKHRSASWLSCKYHVFQCNVSSFLFKWQGSPHHPDRSEQGSGKKRFKWMEADAKDNINVTEAIDLPNSVMSVKMEKNKNTLRNHIWNGLSWGKEFSSEIILICVFGPSYSKGHWI